MASNQDPTKTQEQTKADLRKGIEDLRKLGEDIRKELQAAGADAKRRWKELFEPQLHSAEKLMHEVSGASREALNRTTAAFKEFRESLKKKGGAGKGQPGGEAKPQPIEPKPK